MVSESRRDFLGRLPWRTAGIGAALATLPRSAFAKVIKEIQIEPTKPYFLPLEDLRTIAADGTNCLQVSTAAEYKEQTEEYRGGIVTLVDSPELNDRLQGHRCMDELRALQTFLSLTDAFQNSEIDGRSLRFIYLAMQDDRQLTELGKYFARDADNNVETPQYVLTSPGINATLGARVLDRRIGTFDRQADFHKDLATMRLWVETKLLQQYRIISEKEFQLSYGDGNSGRLVEVPNGML
tara:strand:+ start:2476 stop:3192 length:717 start_codon:yes stop_codon:yes gene_type:complete